MTTARLPAALGARGAWAMELDRYLADQSRSLGAEMARNTDTDMQHTRVRTGCPAASLYFWFADGCGDWCVAGPVARSDITNGGGPHRFCVPLILESCSGQGCSVVLTGGVRRCCAVGPASSTAGTRRQRSSVRGQRCVAHEDADPPRRRRGRFRSAGRTANAAPQHGRHPCTP